MLEQLLPPSTRSPNWEGPHASSGPLRGLRPELILGSPGGCQCPPAGAGADPKVGKAWGGFGKEIGVFFAKLRAWLHFGSIPQHTSVLGGWGWLWHCPGDGLTSGVQTGAVPRWWGTPSLQGHQPCTGHLRRHIGSHSKASPARIYATLKT